MEAFSHYLFVKFSRSTKNKFVIFHTIHLEKKQENMETEKLREKYVENMGKSSPIIKNDPWHVLFGKIDALRWKILKSTSLENLKYVALLG